MSFRAENSLVRRKALAQKIFDTYPDRLPVIIEPPKSNRNVVRLRKQKFLVPPTSTMGELMREIKQNVIDVTEKTALYLFVNNKTLIPMQSTMQEIYARFKDDDGFLYVQCARENAFG